MEVRKEDFPVVVQAFDTTGNTDIFIAEQVVNSQADIDSFTSRYTGKLIKARRLTEAELGRLNNTSGTTTSSRRKSSSGSYILIIILLVIVALVVIGFTTGWIQRTFNIQLSISPINLLLNFRL
ncbi:hypothetical protein [Aridibaculum aurantiacum]|uniref:hypothetical protein n=1 Tax=Aridibaculum aurantiacum TaxID=2810307 RepID=UPI001A96D57F|nr:hypothetical protein [Aridibaculum aurantiacum]